VTLGTLSALPLAGLLLWILFLRLYGPPAARASAAEAVFQRMPAGEVIVDDAGRSCPRSAAVFIELRVQSDAEHYIGHAFLHWPNATLGFRTDEVNIGLVDYLMPWSPSMSGFLRDDSETDYDHARRYCACPGTIEALEVSVIAHANDPYQVGNWRGGRNCATWAADRLRDAGLSPPEGDCPNQLARQMTPCEREVNDDH